ncbi:ATP-binding protein [Cupriavidus necator]
MDMSTHGNMQVVGPYPGLRPFRHDEAEIFFGREEQTDQLLEKLQRSHFIAVVGPSGCGKSSLVRAGMIAALEAGFLADAGARWRIADMRPGSQPLTRLAEALLAPSALGQADAADPAEAAFALAMLRRGPLGLVEIVQEARLPPCENLLILVDQFEEIFRFREQGNADDADAFVALLLTSAAQRKVPIYIVITMRSDFLGECALFLGLPEAINDGQYLTPRLTRCQIEAAVAGPARVFGGEIEPALVNRLLNEIGPDPDQLPLLQHALMRGRTRAGQRGPKRDWPRDATAARNDVGLQGRRGALRSAVQPCGPGACRPQRASATDHKGRHVPADRARGRQARYPPPCARAGHCRCRECTY